MSIVISGHGRTDVDSGCDFTGVIVGSLEFQVVVMGVAEDLGRN